MQMKTTKNKIDSLQKSSICDLYINESSAELGSVASIQKPTQNGSHCFTLELCSEKAVCLRQQHLATV